MQAVIDRNYCLRNRVQIVRYFGWVIFLKMMLSNKKTLLERLTDQYLCSGIAMPGQIGDAYKLSALIEFRMAKIYESMAEQFKDNSQAHSLFLILRDEELEHGRIMLVCLFEIILHENIDFAPSILDPEIRKLLSRLRLIQRRVGEMSLEEALDTTNELEKGEINVIFGKLLKQVANPKLELFEKKLESAKNHSESVPRRINEIREKTARQPSL